MHRQLAQAGHQAIDHQAEQHIHQQRAAGAGLRDRGARGHEQPGADRAADGNHGQVAGLELALEVVVLNHRVLVLVSVGM
ncbi:hypothetical protein D9M72_501340 [compost metagenome]